jgi:hypothetical protein
MEGRKELKLPSLLDDPPFKSVLEQSARDRYLLAENSLQEMIVS